MPTGVGLAEFAKRNGKSPQVRLGRPLVRVIVVHAFSEDITDKSRQARIVPRRFYACPACSFLVETDRDISHKFTISRVSWKHMPIRNKERCGQLQESQRPIVNFSSALLRVWQRRHTSLDSEQRWLTRRVGKRRLPAAIEE